MRHNSAGKVGLVMMSFGYMAARMTRSLKGKVDLNSTAKGAAVVADQDPRVSAQQYNAGKSRSQDAHVQCLHTTLR
ncbi:unnamed protein product [Calypogeia fissa]